MPFPGGYVSPNGNRRFTKGTVRCHSLTGKIPATTAAKASHCITVSLSRKRIAASGIDFFQLFDQDLGGSVFPCFSDGGNEKLFCTSYLTQTQRIGVAGRTMEVPPLNAAVISP